MAQPYAVPFSPAAGLGRARRADDARPCYRRAEHGPGLQTACIGADLPLGSVQLISRRHG